MPILSQPVALRVLLLQLELFLYLLVNLLVSFGAELSDQLLEILDLVHRNWSSLWSRLLQKLHSFLLCLLTGSGYC